MYLKFYHFIIRLFLIMGADIHYYFEFQNKEGKWVELEETNTSDEMLDFLRKKNAIDKQNYFRSHSWDDSWDDPTWIFNGGGIDRDYRFFTILGYGRSGWDLLELDYTPGIPADLSETVMKNYKSDMDLGNLHHFGSITLKNLDKEGFLDNLLTDPSALEEYWECMEDYYKFNKKETLEDYAKQWGQIGAPVPYSEFLGELKSVVDYLNKFLDLVDGDKTRLRMVYAFDS